ncbi:MAG: MazG-like family protein [Candidatus Paceibacterota bacterium]|jgi:NTP pyrophosphatase (non-canonical NTP hydrolase)
MEELKKEIKKYINERGWSILKNPSSISKSISIESSELLEIFQWKDLSIKNIKQDQIILQKIKEELADVLIYSTEMAISLDLDIEKIIHEKLEKNIKKYPASIVKGNQKEYLKIKESYRKNKK